MALRYPADFLLHLQDSPLCIRPPNLPPAEEWMGQPAEQVRTQTKTTGERPRSNDNSILDQGARRPGLHPTRNSANPEDIVFAPPRMAFASARGNKSIDDKTAKEPDASGRFGNFRSRNGDAENDRFREGRPANGFRRRDGEGESEGWSTVKPRKSFGHEGAERFHGRMGGNFRDDRRQPRERDGEAPRDRPVRNFDNFTRDKEGDDAEGRSRNGPNRTKVEPWFKNEPAAESQSLAPEKRERIDRAKSWRDRDKEAEPVDDRNSGRNHDRRWGGREHRVEREPEWLDEPLEEHPEAHTQQDFQKWMEEMKKAKNRAPSAPGKSGPTDSVEAPVEAEKPAQSAPAVEAGPDKFFMAFGGSKSGLDASTPGEPVEAANKPKAAGKSSRFTSFFSHAQEEARGRNDAPSPMAGPPMAGPPTAGPPMAGLPMSAPPMSAPPMSGLPMAGPPMAGPPMTGPPMNGPPMNGPPMNGPPMNGPPMNGLPFLMGGGPSAPPAPEEERQAFQQLLMKLQKQTMSATPPGPSPFSAPSHSTPPDGRKQNSMVSLDQPFQQYGGDRRMEGPPMGRPPPQHVQEILAPRPQPQARPEQLLQDLVGQRQRAPSQPSGRPEVVRNNSNTEFLMNLMRAPAQDAQRNELLMRMAQPQKQPQMPPMNDREPDYLRDQRQMRPQPPPGFPMEDSFRNPDVDVRSNQPTQILQRPPPPPGLDQMPPNWMSGGAQLPPPVQRGPMMGPPGLAGGLGGLSGPNGPNRNMPMPPHMFPPNFPPGGMPPLEAMGGMPPRNMPPPPPGFFGGPPHGFIPPGLGGYNGPPPEFAGAPFEARGMPPSGNPGRGAAYGRQ